MKTESLYSASHSRAICVTPGMSAGNIPNHRSRITLPRLSLTGRYSRNPIIILMQLHVCTHDSGFGNMKLNI